LGGTRAKLEALGIEALGITEDSAEPVRSYYRIRPSKLRLATDPKRDVHRRYGLPMPFYAGAYTQLREATLTNPTGTTQILAAAGNATAGAVADSALDYTLAWNPVFVFFQGGQFRIDLTPLQFGRTGSKELNGTVTLLDQATGPISPIPVPSTAVLVGVGLAGLGFSLRRAHR